MLFLLFIIIASYLIFSGITLLFFEPSHYSRNAAQPFIFGIAFVSMTLLPISFISGINHYLFYTFILLGLLGLIRRRELIPKLIKSPVWASFSFILIISLFMAYEHYPFASDTDIYHMNSVQWLKEYGTVKGLANLSNRFGFNSTWHMLGALFDHGLLEGRSPWVLPCLSYTIGFTYFFNEIFNAKKRWQIIYSALILYWTTINILTWGFPSLHYDFLPLLLISIVFYEVILSTKESPNLKSHKISAWMLLLTFSFTLKQVGALSLIFMFLLGLVSLRKTRELSAKNLLCITIIPLAVFFFWLLRNLYLSGYPLFPASYFAQDFDWTIPLSKVNSIYQDIVGWARMPGPGYLDQFSDPNIKWLPSWLKMQSHSIRFWLLAIIPGSAALFIWIRILLTKKIQSSFFLLTWFSCSLAFWFFSAPDIRFGDGFFFCALGSGVAYLPIFNKNVIKNNMRIYTSICILALVLSSTMVLVVTGKRGPLSFFKIGHHQSGALVQRTTTSGLKVWTPISPKSCNNKSDKFICSSNSKVYEKLPACGNSPIPCTPFFNPQLKLIGTKLEEGFRP